MGFILIVGAVLLNARAACAQEILSMEGKWEVIDWTVVDPPRTLDDQELQNVNDLILGSMIEFGKGHLIHVDLNGKEKSPFEELDTLSWEALGGGVDNGLGGSDTKDDDPHDILRSHTFEDKVFFHGERV